MSKKSLIDQLKEFMEKKARSRLMDFGCVTLGYVYSMWRETMAIEDVASAMEYVR